MPYPGFHQKLKVPYPRERKTPRAFTYPCSTYLAFNKDGGPWEEWLNNTSACVLTGGRSMNDWVTPGFAVKRDRGEIVNNPMSSAETSYEVGSSGFEARFLEGATAGILRQGGPFFVKEIGPPVATPMGIDVQNLVNYARTNALSKCRSSGFKGLVAIAELGKTMRMLTHPLEAIHSLIDVIYQARQHGENLRVEKRNGEVRSINGRKVYRRKSTHRGPGRVVGKPESLLIPISEAISGSVLMYNLGLRPLLMDLQAVLRDIPQAHQQERLSFRSDASESYTDVTTSTVAPSLFQPTFRTETTHKVKVRAVVMVEDTFSVPIDFGVSLMDIPSAVWEVVPFSFVLDYVTNVGDVLDAWRAIATQKILAASTTITVESHAVRQVVGLESTDTRWTISAPPSGTDVTHLITKVREVGIDSPKLAILPGAKMVTPSHVQNILSLTVQKLTGIQKTGKTHSTPF